MHSRRYQNPLSLFEGLRHRDWGRSTVAAEDDNHRSPVGEDMTLVEEGAAPHRDFAREDIGLAVGLHRGLPRLDTGPEGDIQIDHTAVVVEEDTPVARKGGRLARRELVVGRHKVDSPVGGVPRMGPEVAPEEEDIHREDLGNMTFE